MDQSQLLCDEDLDEEVPQELERSDNVQGFSTMVKPDFRASIPGYPAPARKGMKRPMVDYESESEDQPDLGTNILISDDHKINVWLNKLRNLK